MSTSITISSMAFANVPLHPEPLVEDPRTVGALESSLRLSHRLLESVQQSHFGSRFVLRIYKLKCKLGLKRAHLKLILYNSKLKIEMQIPNGVHFSECSTVAENCNCETQIEMRDGTVEHFPGSPPPSAA